MAIDDHLVFVVSEFSDTYLSSADKHIFQKFPNKAMVKMFGFIFDVLT
jgi:hypothetical protein